jgi:hypothetical protein
MRHDPRSHGQKHGSYTHQHKETEHDEKEQDKDDTADAGAPSYFGKKISSHYMECGRENIKMMWK